MFSDDEDADEEGYWGLSNVDCAIFLFEVYFFITIEGITYFYRAKDFTYCLTLLTLPVYRAIASF